VERLVSSTNISALKVRQKYLAHLQYAVGFSRFPEVCTSGYYLFTALPFRIFSDLFFKQHYFALPR
jgi:hypothetical protein